MTDVQRGDTVFTIAYILAGQSTKRKTPVECSGRGRNEHGSLHQRHGEPKKGYVDVRIFSDNRATTQTGEHPFYREMDVIEIKPHGRLIDADEFLKRAFGTKCFHGDFALMLEELVGESTTIIPAEEGI